ncbi:DUF2510 domain-containing protein [Antrihabitans spumae]|jgi:hypothetical protein|uniref:DUF2510 domain-containing protein n=1 Tax=Antrihabitans spumae TaxID=3373370 RepID=A0ABW7KGA5_9NOCA
MRSPKFRVRASARSVALLVAIASAVLGVAACTATDTADESALATSAVVPTRSAAEVSASQAASASASAAAAESVRLEAEARAEAEAARLNPATYSSIEFRDYALLVKDPDAHAGQKVVVYGRVTQFDSATGPQNMLVRTANAPQDSVFDYDINTMVEASSQTLKPVVEDDLVTIYAEVVGSYTYDTQRGGNTTVPKLRANIVEVTGSAAN